MKVVILAGGLGTRLKPQTLHQPKVMIKIGAKPILEHLVNLCVKHDFKQIIISLHYLPKVVTDYFKSGQRFNADISYSIEEKPLGGAGALKHTEKLLRKDSFFVLNGDVLTNLNLNAMAKFHRLKRGLGTFLVHKTDHPLDSDLIEYDNNYLIKRFFRPQPGDKFKPISKSGSHIFEPKVLDFIPENTKYSLEKQLIPNLLDQGEKLCAYYSDCYSKDMGTPQRLARVKKDFENGKITF
ncbi:MAG: Nucleotidyl transferase [Candidatus Beckwithbacteria bacterium GW2011_GWB1_47_15]|uniref:Nucleotidyl transferase n=1 Tax=Candidatus Beckwithbacteria bacterium GW2011_GWB1_47_15 TaxID=1618371 RepID=A0A0G1RV11_9BACT|nr:MAG: nucleotidyl transferase, mannose-1-phosphate guanylyltransferase, phosphomannomutase [Candidatus Beckwithbacteria bacterium GW2011_GWC1_49_16]KKU35738.1 MAG: Nucleotidyl transferase [Candidatus Beckwithbacteria bacterium GW2011_GWA1_46_30]KKU60992.1 MAG: Nucleotidyl transferase [Candidatus Beckwithbacteria bacterium GW2011_GWB1_47_15]KKU72297.1 MAG: Nucleotidyl transferase [Candidatus Beckwithbacteria bacterium GW2011_GWA2_47_25]KKW04943.1 MAG: Nucleotidyl transferase [Candidatus Beckwi